jgi:microcystin degradation protein MlrC
MKSLVDECVEADENNDEVLDTSIVEGYPYADVEQMGMSWITITDNNSKLAEKISKDLAYKAWDKREDLNRSVPSIREALKEAQNIYVGPKPEGEENYVPTDGSALQEAEKTEHSHLGPVVLMDAGDNIGGGSTADSTHILKVAQEMKIDGFLQTLYDPESVEVCVNAGEGAEVTIDVGGKTDNMHGEPITITGTVIGIHDGKYEEHRPSHGGFRFHNDGLRVRVDTNDGKTIILTSLRTHNKTREQLYSMGIKPENYKVIVAKGVSSPRPAYQPIASEIIVVNSPGVTSADLSTFEYKNIRKSLFPFQEPDYPPK